MNCSFASIAHIVRRMSYVWIAFQSPRKRRASEEDRPRAGVDVQQGEGPCAKVWDPQFCGDLGYRIKIK